ncbi:leucine-rich repeat serine/threonine-protein kinase 2-like isoform X4 [Lytechinus pictus]|uniref:leucine-rich repeat serine/threonine-protein kinase 2-like isoform X4 n=1 Tax=Lytechinus pictus TaxID=7653 RepID=UPI0030B9CDDA
MASPVTPEDERMQKSLLDELLRLKLQFDPSRLSEILLKISVLCEQDAVASTLQEYHAHAQVLQVMDQHTYNADIQEAGCTALAAMMQVSDKLKDLVHKKNIHSQVLDIMGQHKDDPKVQASAMKTIAFLAMAEDTCMAMLEEDVIGAILEAMKVFPGDAPVQKNACNALKQLLTDEFDRQVEFVDKGKHRLITAAVHFHCENHVVLEEAFWLLAILAIPEECYDVLLQETHKDIIAAIKRFPDAVGVQTACCALIEALAQTEDSQQLFVLNDVSDLLIDALRRFSENARYLTICLSVMDRLAEAIFTAPKWLDRMLNDNWMNETFMALTKHQDSPPCLENALRALTTLVSYRPGMLVEMITEESASMAVDSAVLMSLRLHSKNSKIIFEMACDAIQALAENSDTMQRSLVEKGVLIDIKSGMLTYSRSHECQAAASRAIRGLCLIVEDRDDSIHVENKQAVTEAGIHTLLFDAIRGCSDNADVLLDIVNTITCLADMDVVKHQCMVEGIHEVILEGMEQYQDDPNIQELFLETMVVLSSAEGMIDILVDAGILSLTVEVMEKYSQIEAIQENGTILLQTIVNKKKSICDDRLAEKIAKAIISSMKKFRKAPSILAESCVAMQFLADISQEVTKTLVNYNAHEELFHILEAYKDDDTLVNLVCECLYILCCKWEFTDQMLLWACKKNLMKGVEVLVELGADVNAGEGYETPMCFACENNNVDMVKQLLKQGISDLHTPLSLSLKLKHHHIIGLLLYQMGYDRQAGSLTWSSLGLASLNPEWLYKVFLDEEPPDPDSANVSGLTEADSGNSSIIASRILMKRETRQQRLKIKEQLAKNDFTKVLKWTFSTASLPSPGGPRNPPPPVPVRRIQSKVQQPPPSVIISAAQSRPNSMIETTGLSLLERRASADCTAVPIPEELFEEIFEGSDQGGGTATLMPCGASTPQRQRRPLSVPVGSTAATSDTDDELAEYWRDQPSPSLGRLPSLESRSSQGLDCRYAQIPDGRRSPLPDGRQSPLAVETLLRNSTRSASVSSFFESFDETDVDETTRRKRLSSGSELPPRTGRLRKRSLSSAQLPFLMDDPRWTMHLEQNLGSSIELSGSESSIAIVPSKPVLSKRESIISIASTADSSSMYLADESLAGQNLDASSQEERRLSGLPPGKFFQFTSFSSDQYDSSTADDFSDAGMIASNVPDIVSQIGGQKPQRMYRNTPQRQKRRSLTAPSGMHDLPEGPDVCIKFVDLSANNVSDLTPLARAPHRLLQEFRFLEKLDLSDNGLTEFPRELTDCMPELQELNLRCNGITELPTHLLSLSKLTLLDLSHNQIKDLNKTRPGDTAFKLAELDLSHNATVRFPSWLSMFVPSLQKLTLASNKIETIPNKPLNLQLLKSLDLSNNKLTTLTPVFLHGCLSLEQLSATNNQLDSLPGDLDNILGKLKVLKLAKNHLGIPESPFIPKFILHLPVLRDIDLSDNGIIEFPPPSEWKSQTLREIIISHNKIKKLTLGDNLRSWSKLERLILSHNKLTKVPKELGQLTLLASLDLSHNKSITTIPDELGQLNKLWEFPLDGLKLDLDPAILRGRTKDIIGFLNQKFKRAEAYNRMKLMVVGYGGRGKSTLLARLQGQKFEKKGDNVATVGVVVKEWVIQIRKKDFCLSTWDFAGQEDFYSTHPCFLTGRALFLVVYDISRGPDEITTLRPWLLTIQALAPSCPVIVVGTHKDKIPKDHAEDFITDMQMRVLDVCRSPGFPAIKGYIDLSAVTETGDIQRLKGMIEDVILNEKIKGQPIFGQMIPYSYLRLEQLLQEQVKRLKGEGMPPVMLHKQVIKMIRENDLQLDDNELSQAVRFLHETGVLLHYDDPSQQLRNVYFIEPQWLCKVMARVITVREINPLVSKEGIMKVKDISLLFNDGDIPKELIPQYLKLLERFEVSLPVSDDKILLPCKVPIQKPNIALPISDARQDILVRLYSMHYIPMDLWMRLNHSLLLYTKYMLPRTPRFRMRSHEEPETVFWREGIYVCWSEEAFFLIEPLKKGADTLKITVPKTKQGYRLLGLVSDHLDDLIEEWFPGLCELDPRLGRPLVQRLVPCIMCEGRPHLHDLSDLLELSEKSDTITCPNHPTRKVPLQILAPDVTLADLEDKFLLDPRKLNFIQRSENLLGDGSFGSVYKATYRDKSVAVKVFSKGGESHPHRLLRQEVTVLRHLQHPSLVSMEGVGLNPRILVMELATLGSLNTLLASGRVKNRNLQHRIAMQVAEGLAFLHKNRIVYRDLKPDNVLIFSLALGTLQNAKISDYGISRFATPYGLKSSEGTPGYRAPEVIRGTSNYNTEVDIYSFGILLYELVSEGRRPFEEMEFRTEIDEAVIKGQHLPPISQGGVAPWPDLQELIDHCTEHIPESRPTAQEAFEKLSSAEMLCLKQASALLSGVNVECQAVRTYQKDDEERTEVWLAGGEKNSTMFSCFTIRNSEQDASVQGMIIQKGRALCMVAIGPNTMLVGTQSCELVLIDLTSSPYQVKHTLPQLSDAVLSLSWQAKRREDGKVFAGLANGTIAVFSAKKIRSDKDCKPDQYITVGTYHEPVKCSYLTNSRLWVGVRDRVEAITLKTLKSEVKLEHDKKETSKDPRKLGLVKSVALDKCLWLCRHNSSVIEVWNTGKQQLKTTIDIKDLIGDQFPGARISEFDVKSMMLQSRTALWVGTAAGKLVLIDVHTYQLITVIGRHVSGLRSILAVSKGVGKGGGKNESVVVTAGMGFVPRPGVPHLTETNYSYALVWDAELKNQVRYLQADAERRKKTTEGNTKGWHKVQAAILAKAFKK